MERKRRILQGFELRLSVAALEAGVKNPFKALCGPRKRRFMCVWLFLHCVRII